MDVTIQPAKTIKGRVRLPGDKSISHRLAMLAAIAEGTTRIENFAASQDCHSTLACLRLLGTEIQLTGESVVSISGRGLRGLLPSSVPLDAGNSGSTIRMLSGILAGQSFETRISGDESLRGRPMKRIIAPLREMGAQITAHDDNYPPLTIQGCPLHNIQYVLPVASAQVKSAILLAGLYCEGETTVIERVATRNHTELAMQSFGVPVTLKDRSIQIKGNSAPSAIQTTVPGDISSGAFLIAAATLLPGSQLLLQDVGMNPGRRTFVDLLLNMGASIEVMNERVAGGEPIADLLVGSALLKGGTVSGELIPQVIDEIPILAVLATQTEIGMEIRDAGELRVKESDRIRSIVDNLRVMGGEVEELPDGLIVKGRQSLHGGRISTYRDHRIAMAFAIAGLTAVNPTLIEEAECAGVSFPSFFEILSRLVN